MLGFSATGCSRTSKEAVATPEPFQRNGNTVIVPEGSALRERLQFATADAELVQRQLSAPAVVEADPARFARVFPPLSGHLLKLHVQIGEEIAEGQLLATLQSADFTTAQGDYTKAKNTLQLTERALRRQQTLAEAKIAAAKDVEQAETDFANAQSDLASAAGRLYSYGFDPEKDSAEQFLPVRSPVAGKVVDITAAQREFRNDSTAPLLTVADFSIVWLTASVQEKDLRFLKKDQEITATLNAYPGEVFKGKTFSIGDMIDGDTRTIKVRSAFANTDGRLKPGMFATVDFADFPSGQVTVPTTAIVQIGNSTFVFVQIKPWEFQAREVVLGPQVGDRTIISEGVEAGATVVAKEGVMLQ